MFALYKDHWNRGIGHEALYKVGSVQYHHSIEFEKEIKGKNKDNYVRDLRGYTREEKEISNERRRIKQVDKGIDEWRHKTKQKIFQPEFIGVKISDFF